MIKYYGLILILLLGFSNCRQSSTNEFPEKIDNIKTNKHIRIKGTKIYCVIPDEYEYIKELARYQKNDKLYIQFIESNASSFTQAKPNFTKKAMEAKGAKVDVVINTRINNYEGVYFEGPSKYSGETKIGLFFGNDSFVVMIVGVCKTSNKTGFEDLQKIMTSILYDSEIKVNPLELANFTFDQSITGFKYTMTASNFFIYSENGKEDAQNPTANSMNIGAMPLMSSEKAEEFAKDLLWRYERSGIKLNSKQIIKTKINNKTAFVLETNVDFENNKGILYQAMIIGENSSVIFMASAYSNQDDYLNKYKETVKSIEIQ